MQKHKWKIAEYQECKKSILFYYHKIPQKDYVHECLLSALLIAKKPELLELLLYRIFHHAQHFYYLL